MKPLHPKLKEITDRIIERSRPTREVYLNRIRALKQQGKVERDQLGCSNLAHGYASMPKTIKIEMQKSDVPNIGMISAYNDMVSAHQPFKDFPDWIKDEAQKFGATAQVAGGTPAMCDGITQGYEGMELSLFSRDVIAMSTAVGLSHQMFDGALFFGVCDKIVPGLMIGALSCGHIPALFVPAGPMQSGIGNKEKARTRQLFAEGKVGREALLASEMGSYHSPGTCTFYGTANSNQMMMEFMGVHLPAAAFFNPYIPMREALTRHAAAHMAQNLRSGSLKPIGEMLSEKSFINAIIGLMATGGSTNHTMHLVAMARAAGVILNWDDFDEISSIIPLLIRVYPNGQADVNHFAAAGGLPFVIRELRENGLLHDDVDTVIGHGMAAYTQEPFLDNGKLVWKDATEKSLNEDILRTYDNPFSPDGGLKLMKGNIGRGVIKVSAMKPNTFVIEAPAIVFDDQRDVLAPMVCLNYTSSHRLWQFCKTADKKWHWLPMDGCRAHRAKCLLRFICRLKH